MYVCIFPLFSGGVVWNRFSQYILTLQKGGGHASTERWLKYYALNIYIYINVYSESYTLWARVFLNKFPFLFALIRSRG